VLFRSDADIIESDLYDEGWTDDNLKKLFTQFRDELMEELNDKSIGGFDVFLYNWTNGEFFLGGAPLVDDSDDILIKYCYGWNKTKYGQLILKQNNMLDNFLELSTIAIKKEIVETAIEYLMSPGNIANHYINQESRKQVIKKCNKFIKVENNQITIQYTKIMDMINLVLFIQNGDFYERTGVDNPEEYHQYSEFLIQLKENFPSNLDPNTIIDEISDDLIILSAK